MMPSMPRDGWFFLGVAAAIVIVWKVLAVSVKTLLRILVLAVLCYAGWHLYLHFR